MNILVATALTALASAGFGFVFNRIARNREAAADALVGSVRDAQRAQFVLDLENEDHATLIAQPLESWRSFVAPYIRDRTVLDETVATKARELLEWRMNEREARLRFVVTASGTSVKSLARYHSSHTLHLVSMGAKNIELVDRHYDVATSDLIRTIRTIRTPGLVSVLHRALEYVPVVNRRLVTDEDIRILIADYAERRSPTHLSSGLSRLIGVGGD